MAIGVLGSNSLTHAHVDIDLEIPCFHSLDPFHRDQRSLIVNAMARGPFAAAVQNPARRQAATRKMPCRKIRGACRVGNIVKVLLPGVALACAASSLCAAERALNTLPAESAFSALQWRGIGPFRGGRAVAVAGV